MFIFFKFILKNQIKFDASRGAGAQSMTVKPNVGPIPNRGNEIFT